jgi:pimeloyl-ACP methyl ester carboxylesterase
MSTLFLQHENGTIAYDDMGSGPLVVCSPSLGDLRAEYRFLTPILVGAGYRVVTMDLRGHGETSTQWDDYSVAGVGSDLEALIRSLDAGPAVIIGTSMSAGAGVWVAAEAPELVSGLVMIGPAVRGELGQMMRLLMNGLFSRPWGPALWKKYYSGLYPTRKPADFEPYLDALKNNLQETGRIEAAKRMILASKAASEVRLPRVEAPALVIMGSKDPDFKDPQAEARWVAESVKGEYHMVAEAGHYPHAEMPELTGQRILSFLQEIVPQRVEAHGA